MRARAAELRREIAARSLPLIEAVHGRLAAVRVLAGRSRFSGAYRFAGHVLRRSPVSACPLGSCCGGICLAGGQPFPGRVRHPPAALDLFAGDHRFGVDPAGQLAQPGSQNDPQQLTVR